VKAFIEAYSGGMSILRAICLWLLMLAVPAQSWATVAMTHCKDTSPSVFDQQSSPHHDHAAMMREMAGAASSQLSEGDHAHHVAAADGSDELQQSPSGDDIDQQLKQAGCECGCECGGSCTMTCAASVVSLVGHSRHQTFDLAPLVTATQCGRAAPAHRFTPLRPPSAVAI